MKTNTVIALIRTYIDIETELRVDDIKFNPQEHFMTITFSDRETNIHTTPNIFDIMYQNVEIDVILDNLTRILKDAICGYYVGSGFHV